MFSSVPGFYSSYDRTYSYLGVRGFGRPTDYNNRILLLVNGMQTNEVIFGSSLLETGFGIDLSDVERIEIVRRPGSTLYGTGAMLAVINIITKKGAGANGLSLTGEAGSLGRLKGKAAYGKAFQNGLDFFISGNWADIDGQDLYFKEYDDPSTNNGVAEGLDWACDTGVGALHASEGVLGLQRAFRAAGARTVVMSLWAVDDQASRDWMAALYRARFERRLSTAESVQAAALEILRQRRARGFSHPFSWGGFVATGDWR